MYVVFSFLNERPHQIEQLVECLSAHSKKLPQLRRVIRSHFLDERMKRPPESPLQNYGRVGCRARFLGSFLRSLAIARRTIPPAAFSKSLSPTAIIVYKQVLDTWSAGATVAHIKTRMLVNSAVQLQEDCAAYIKKGDGPEPGCFAPLERSQ